jgi:CSLREA domain-containing protein
MATILARLLPVALLAALNANAATFVVNSEADAVDATPGDGVCETVTGGGTCTLRAAILEANALAGADSVTLPVGEYASATALPGSGDTPEVADFDITGDLQITGAGPGASIIEGNYELQNEAPDRVLEIGVGATVTLTGVTIHGGLTIYASGGGILNHGTLTLSDCVVHANGVSAYPILVPGGGIYSDGTLTVTRCDVSENYTFGNGGGIANDGTLVVEDSVLRANTGSSGGGIANSGTLTVRNSTVAANRARGTFNSSLYDAEGAGAGIFDAGGTGSVEHTTISGNIVGINNGICCTPIPDYYGTGAGLGEANGMGTSGISIRSSIISGNIHEYPGAADNDCGTPPPVSLGHNLDGDGTCLLTGTGDLPSTDPQLGPLADNGGPTLTFALPAGSPAIDAADGGACPAADQRGVSRPQGGGCDIGAFENNLPCGNGTLDAGEQCDDGNPAAGDCCSFLCQYAPVNTACDVEGDPCTDDRCDGAGGCALSTTIVCAPCETCSGPLCVPGPRTLCRPPLEEGRSTLTLRTDLLTWRWPRGGMTTSNDLGDPVASDDYALCMFDRFSTTSDPRVKIHADLAAGGVCGSQPCWTGLGQPPGSRGFRYRDRQRSQAGIEKVVLHPGVEGRSSFLVKGKGPGLGLDPLDVHLPTVLQLQRVGGACWEATFESIYNYGNGWKLKSAAAP